MIRYLAIASMALRGATCTVMGCQWRSEMTVRLQAPSLVPEWPQWGRLQPATSGWGVERQLAIELWDKADIPNFNLEL